MDPEDDVERQRIHDFVTTTTTTPPIVIPLTRGMGRSECRQPYPCKYHYSQIAYSLILIVEMYSSNK